MRKWGNLKSGTSIKYILMLNLWILNLGHAKIEYLMNIDSWAFKWRHEVVTKINDNDNDNIMQYEHLQINLSLKVGR